MPLPLIILAAFGASRVRYARRYRTQLTTDAALHSSAINVEAGTLPTVGHTSQPSTAALYQPQHESSVIDDVVRPRPPARNADSSESLR